MENEEDSGYDPSDEIFESSGEENGGCAIHIAKLKYEKVHIAKMKDEKV